MEPPTRTGSAPAAPAQCSPVSTAGAGPSRGPAGGRLHQQYSDEFMMYTFKVEMCKRVDKHDREACPYAHPGEVARRRHPSLYQALPCPEARAKKICPRLENCNCSHSTWEIWLHPDRYKTFLCERGAACNRPICFFAHSEDELRELPSGLRRAKMPTAPAGSSGGASWHGTQQQQQQQQQLPSYEQGGPSASWQAAEVDTAAGADPAQGPAGPTAGMRQQQHLRQRQHHPVAGYHQPVYFAPTVPYTAAGGPAGAAGFSGMAQPTPQHQQQRGRTVAVIHAGPSAWQGNSLLETPGDEAPSLEALCAAVARSNLGAQAAEQPPPQVMQQVPPPSLPQQQRLPQPVPVASGQQPPPQVGLMHPQVGLQFPVMQQAPGPMLQQPGQQQQPLGQPVMPPQMVTLFTLPSPPPQQPQVPQGQPGQQQQQQPPAQQPLMLAQPGPPGMYVPLSTLPEADVDPVARWAMQPGV